MAKSNRKIFAFDMGTSSLGICVREGEKVDRLESLLIPNEYASTKEAAMRRRLIRTRLAHAKREQWWRKCAAEAGIEVLETRQPIYASRGVLVKYKPDPRMLREFSVSGDETVYNSALLRIALLRGKKLDGWQVFKAIWSAFQHRGFMPASELPWARNPKRVVSDEETGDDTKELSEKDKKEQDDEKMNRAAANDYLARISVYPKDCQLPCYYEAGRMGLWDPKNPESFKFRHEKPDPAPARNKGDVQVVAPRTLVEKEIRIMLEKAVVLFPKLKGKIDYVMYGETGLPFASVNKPGEWRCVRGSEIEAQGILGQKTPRFDNRAVNQCCLIPRLNVCKAEKPLNKEVRFLLALKNIRYSYKDKPDCALEPLQINEIFDGFINNKWPAQPPVAKKAKNLIVSEDIWRALLYDKGEWKQQYHITPSKWTKWVVNRLGCNVNPAHTEISAPKTGGRSSYCRPALSLVKELMLSGKDPSGFYSEKLKTCANSDPRKGLVKEDLEFLREMGDSWYSIHIPDNRLKDARQMKTPAERFARRQEIINNVRNPVVRHRLGYLVSRLQGLKDTYGEPERVIFEFVREDFMGKEALHRFEVNIKKNKDARDIAFKEAEQLGLKGQGILKMRLYREQGGFDYYESGENEKIAETEIENCEIDHIVPRALKGPDAFYNLILTKSANNRNKNNRTPFQWIGNQPEWKKLEAKVSQRSCHLSERKKKILLSSEPEKLIEKYTALAETAYIAKLAQKITSLFFGWPESVKDSTKRIFVSNGSQTARV
ncbi:MAG: hypothetical protein KKH28_07580, partial [Elusimicrobia bacterium]|nr:hypothetical protein [Elusimicrobiota bacterium]